MSAHLQFGYALGRQLQVKQAGGALGWLSKTMGGAADAAKAAPPVPARAAAPIVSDADKLQQLGAAIRGGTPAAASRPVTAARMVGMPTTPTGAGAKPAWLRNREAVQRGINPATGVRPGARAPAPPPVPAAPARGQGALATPAAQPKVTISPAEAAAGRSKVTISPQDVAGAVPPAAPARPGTVGPKPPRPKPVGFADVSNADWAEVSKGFDAYDAAAAAAARPKVTISPAEAAAAVPARNSPRDNQSGRGFDLLRAGGFGQ